MSFPHTGCIKRTNQSFRSRAQTEHHKEKSKIEDLLDTDMVADFPTSDPLHLLELGIMKRCLLRWVEGTKSYKTKLRPNELTKINGTLLRLKAEMPSEIHRAIRDLSTLRFWKGTEFRTFLLYLGIVALKEVVIEEEYEHFKMLSCAVILCSSDVYKHVVHNSTIVDDFLSDYIEEYIQLYGEQSITSNVHNLCHLLDDVRRFGNLNTISTYPFENCLQMIKKKLRAMTKPLEQLARRIGEIETATLCETYERTSHAVELKYPIDHSTKFQTIFFDDFRLSSRKFGDRWFMDKTKRIIELKYATRVNGLVSLHGFEVKQKKKIFCESTAVIQVEYLLCKYR